MHLANVAGLTVNHSIAQVFMHMRSDQKITLIFKFRDLRMFDFMFYMLAISAILDFQIVFAG